MELHYGLPTLDPARKRVVTVGSFDGVHRGHQALLQRLCAVAKQEDTEAVVVTFEPHPRIALGRDEGFQLLTDTAEKATLMASYGVDRVVVLPFDKAFAALSGEAFARDILQQQLHAKVLVAGYNHRFGHDRLAASALSIEGLAVIEVGACELEGQRLSSTLIRNLIAEGDTAAAERFLGHSIQLLQR